MNTKIYSPDVALLFKARREKEDAEHLARRNQELTDRLRNIVNDSIKKGKWRIMLSESSFEPNSPPVNNVIQELRDLGYEIEARSGTNKIGGGDWIELTLNVPGQVK